MLDIVWLAGSFVTALTIVPVLWQLRRHPQGLRTLFFMEMWERFSYYGMRGLLIFYLTQHFLFDDTFAAGQYGAYTSLIYCVPLIGGFLADRYIGTRKAIAFGALLLIAGHLALVVEGPAAQQVLKYDGRQYTFDVDGRMEARLARIVVDGQKYQYGPGVDGGFEIKGLPQGAPLPTVLPKGSYEFSVKGRSEIFEGVFYLALALIIMGIGFLKANISAIVGQLYEQDDPRRDSGFTLYSYGINLGAFWASIACGWLGTNIGWWAGFGAAGLGMTFGYVVFVRGRSLLQAYGQPPDPERLGRPLLLKWMNLERLIYAGGLIGVAAIWIVVQRHVWMESILSVGSVVALAYIAFFMATKCSWSEARRLIFALILIAFSVVFWTLFEQAGSSMNQFAERNTQLSVGALQFTAAQTQLFNSGFILFLAPIFSVLWAYLGRFNLNPNPALKFGLALVQVGAGFYVLVWGAAFADSGFRVPLVFLALAYCLHTTGELCLSPIGLSQMTRLAPVGLISTVMGTWFLASSWAQYIGGMVAQLTAAETVAGQVLDPAKALQTYVSVFQMIGSWGLTLGVGLIILSPFLALLARDSAQRRADFYGLGTSVGRRIGASGRALAAAAGLSARAAPSVAAFAALALAFLVWPEDGDDGARRGDARSVALSLGRDGHVLLVGKADAMFVRSVDDGVERAIGNNAAAPSVAAIDESNRAITVDETGVVRRSGLPLISMPFAGMKLNELLAPWLGAEVRNWGKSRLNAPVADGATVTDQAPPGTIFKDCVTCPQMVIMSRTHFRPTTRRVLRVARPFAVSAFKATFVQWDECVADHACKPQGDDRLGRGGRRAVLLTTWDQANTYVAWLSKKTGKSYRLLTVREWEYVADPAKIGREYGREPIAMVVGTTQANAYGLYDVEDTISELVTTSDRLSSPAMRYEVCGNVPILRPPPSSPEESCMSPDVGLGWGFQFGLRVARDL